MLQILITCLWEGGCLIHFSQILLLPLALTHGKQSLDSKKVALLPIWWHVSIYMSRQVTLILSVGLWFQTPQHLLLPQKNFLQQVPGNYSTIQRQMHFLIQSLLRLVTELLLKLGIRLKILIHLLTPALYGMEVMRAT
jgi:hypothetical protein